ncbi:hypothetical protein ACWEG1_06095 [Streptomyces bauhiniae]
MPSLTTLVDNFNDNIIGPNWGDSYGSATETGGQARVPLTAGVYAGYQTGRAWTLAGASIYLKLATRPAASTGTDVSCNFLITSSTDGTAVGFTFDAVAGKLRLQSMVGYSDPSAVELTYDPVAHLWLRLREDGTNVYWDTSPNGSTWTTRRTLATPTWVTTSIDTCAVNLGAYRNAGATDYAAFDNVNTLSDGAVLTGSAALTGDSSLGAAERLAVGTASALTGEPKMAATPTMSIRAASSLSSEATLIADSSSTDIPEVAGMPAGVYNLSIEQGATLVRTITSNPEDPAFTWAGWSPRAQIRTSTDADAELLLDLTPYLTVSGQVIALMVPADVTQTLTRSGRWDLELVKDGIVVRLLEGRVQLSPEVTR